MNHHLNTTKGIDMKRSEFARWLKAQGVIFQEGKKHTKLFFNGKQSTLPRHAAVSE